MDKDNSGVIRFKCLLEYFVAHLNYVILAQKRVDDKISTEEKEKVKGYETYLKELIEKKEFRRQGQGYKGNKIQQQIKNWAIFKPGTICLNVSNQHGNYLSKSTYLNWCNTWKNIRPFSNNSDLGVERLYISQMEDSKQPISEHDFQQGYGYSIDELGLYDNNEPNETLKRFYDTFMSLNEAPQLTMYEKYKHLIDSKLNIILQGAPGTGKTYATAELATQIIGIHCKNRKELREKFNENLIKLNSNKDIIDGQIAFVTFHQSMDYEDFIEGYKPDPDANPPYRVVDGLFKKFSNFAKKNWEEAAKDHSKWLEDQKLQNCIESFLDSHIENEKQLSTKNESKFTITGYDSVWIYVYNAQNKKTSDLKIKKEELFYLLTNYEKLNKVKDIKKIFKRPHHAQTDSYLFTIFSEIKKETFQESIENTDQPELKKYVLIIDEINRGNISKIFGELISLIEKDKRLVDKNKKDCPDESLKAILPYSQAEFSIPPNLYIIGTMNTTDRSVGIIDYAIRRRFCFITLPAREDVINEQNDDFKKPVELFKAVRCFLEKNKIELDIEDLMVGHSYFLIDKDIKDKNVAIESKWRYEILPLIREYYQDGLIKTFPSHEECDDLDIFIKKYGPNSEIRKDTTNNNSDDNKITNEKSDQV